MVSWSRAYKDEIGLLSSWFLSDLHAHVSGSLWFYSHCNLFVHRSIFWLCSVCKMMCLQVCKLCDKCYNCCVRGFCCTPYLICILFDCSLSFLNNDYYWILINWCKTILHVRGFEWVSEVYNKYIINWIIWKLILILEFQKCVSLKSFGTLCGILFAVNLLAVSDLIIC